VLLGCVSVWAEGFLLHNVDLLGQGHLQELPANTKGEAMKKPEIHKRPVRYYHWIVVTECGCYLAKGRTTIIWDKVTCKRCLAIRKDKHD